MDVDDALQPRWLTLEQAAKYLQIRPHTLRGWAYQRLVRAYKGPIPGGKSALRFRQDDLDAALQPLEDVLQSESAASA